MIFVVEKKACSLGYLRWVLFVLGGAVAYPGGEFLDLKFKRGNALEVIAH